MKEETSQPQEPIPLAANLGWARPPILYLAAILVGRGLHFARPMGLVPGVVRPFGALIAAFAVALFFWSIRTFRLAGTPVRGNQPTTNIVKSGPYQFSRNPIYLAFSLFQTGLALAANDAWLLVTLLPALCLMAFVVIPREERYLQARFGEEYANYRATVRRWF